MSTVTFDINGESVYAAHLPGRKSWALVSERPGVLTALAYFRSEADARAFNAWINIAVLSKLAKP